MAASSLGCRFTKDGDYFGEATQAPFSVFGKMLVKNEGDELIGSVVYRLGKTRFLSSEGKELGIAKRYRDGKLQWWFGPSRAHLAQRFVLETSEEASLDERLLFSYVCYLIAAENGGSTG